MKKLVGISNFIKSCFYKTSDNLGTNLPNIKLLKDQLKSFGLNSNNNHYPWKQNYFFQNNKHSEKHDEKEKNYEKGYSYYNSSSTVLDGMDFSKIYCLFGLFTIFAYKKIKCYPASDKEIDKIRTNLENEIKSLEFKYQGKLRRQPINYGIRGTKYFVEFNINQANVDVDSIINRVQMASKQAKMQANLQILDTNSLTEEDIYTYKMDYLINSSLTPGAKNKGTIYLRGQRGMVYDNFVFTLEKQNDFHDLELQFLLSAYEEAFKPRKLEQTRNNNINHNNNNQHNKSKGWLNSIVGDKDKGGESDPISTLQKYGISVFLPGDNTKKNHLDWDYIAGYESVKRTIEDTVMLALSHGEIYDQITSGTRMKNETNRPKAILFEGPPGCGKTTTAKIIANQVNIPLIYMPIEAIMSKWYGESENRFAEIFEAAKGMGRSILFIDEIDALAISREGNIHEGTRRILSTLLRKIDGFESDGEVLVIMATNRKKDLDPALVSRLDMSIHFDLPDERMRSLIFQRYAKQLSQEELETLGKLSVDLSGRDISDICKGRNSIKIDAERRWASMYIRKEKKNLLPEVETYKDCLSERLKQMKNVNRQFDTDKTFWKK